MGVPASNVKWEGGDKNYLSKLVDNYANNNRLLSDAIENGRINPKFSKYSEAMALAENEIDDIYKNEKNIDSSLKVFQRSITKFLNQ